MKLCHKCFVGRADYCETCIRHLKNTVADLEQRAKDAEEIVRAVEWANGTNGVHGLLMAYRASQKN